MKRILVILLVLLTATSDAQLSRYIIRFSNKGGTPFTLTNPSSYLSQRAIDRRTRYGIAIDSTDLPVSSRYIDSVKLAGEVTFLNSSRWLNQISVQTNDAAALAKVRAFPFVQTATAIAARRGDRSGGQASNEEETGETASDFRLAADYFDYGASQQQINIHNGQFLHNIGLRGQGMVIGMLDGGFFNYTTLRAFDSVNQNGQVLGTWDFVARESSVVEDNSHGMQCFSVIAANIPSQFVGSAPKASFYLFRTEDAATEFPVEEHNWVCAAERLDSAGGDVLSSSLGYSDGMTDPTFNHTYAEMNGRTTIAARGAAVAARKGLLVVNSAGNQGNESFRYIATPADADSVMAVGAVNKSGVPAGFSSYGPSADGQVKPDVASVGVATTVQATNNSIATSNGTSFSAPNMAGLATCLWQGFPEANNIKILNALRRAGNKAATPDDRVGYGVPEVKKAVMELLQNFSAASVAQSGSCRYLLNWTSKDNNTMFYEIERKGAGEATFRKIGSQSSTGNEWSKRSYQFTDSVLNLSPGIVQYRIRQVIDTAAASLAAGYIDTVSIDYQMTCNVTGLTPVQQEGVDAVLLPNPTSGTINLRITTLRPVASLRIRVVDGKGSRVYEQQLAKPAGTITIPVQADRLAKGAYYLTVFDKNTTLVTKEFIKQ
jgi:hypothetical protein